MVRNYKPKGRNPAKINEERKQFLATFAYLFPVTTKTMGVKCWRNFARLPQPERAFMLKAMIIAGLAQSDADEEKAAKRAVLEDRL